MIDERMSDLIGMIYEAALQPQLWPDVLELVATLTPSVVATLYSHDTVARTPTFHQSYGTNPDFTQIYIEKWAASNPIIDAMTLLEPGQVAGLSSILDYDDFVKTPFFQQWGKPQRYCDAVNLMLERTPTRVASVSLIRSDEQGLVDPPAIARLKMLAPHFLRAVRIGRALEHAAVKEATITQTLDALSAAMFLLSDSNTLVHANKSAIELLARGVTLESLQKASEPKRAAAKSSSRQSIEQANAADDVTFIFNLNEGERFVCHRLPLKFKAENREMSLIAVQSTMLTRAAIDQVAALFDLTRRERDVLFGLVEIGGIPATSAMLGLSKNTTKGYLQDLFRKTETQSQSELVKLVCGLNVPFRKPV